MHIYQIYKGWYIAKDRRSGNVGNGSTFAKAIADCLRSIQVSLNLKK